MPAVADECRLISNGLKIDLFPGTTHLSELLLICEDTIQSLSDLVNVEESHWLMSTGGSESGSNTQLTDKMAKTCTQLDFGFHKGISVTFEGHKENFLHLVCQLTKTPQRGRRNG
jgi:hypothetical protein